MEELGSHIGEFFAKLLEGPPPSGVTQFIEANWGPIIISIIVIVLLLFLKSRSA